jgi:hypothetical protein
MEEEHSKISCSIGAYFYKIVKYRSMLRRDDRDCNFYHGSPGRWGVFTEFGVRHNNTFEKNQ